MTKPFAKSLLSILTLLAVGAYFGIHEARAAVVVGGNVTLSFDETQFALVGLTNINSFNQATANSMTGAQLLADAGSISWSGISYGVNPTTPLVDPAGRNLQETTFSYDESNLTLTATGQIGLGGVSRWDVDPLFGGGVFVLGDYALTYSAGTWRLQNNVSFPAPSFFLSSPSLTSVSDTGFTLSGNLFADSGLIGFGFNGTVSYGTFSMVATAIPEPSVVALLLLAAGGGVVASRRRRTQ